MNAMTPTRTAWICAALASLGPLSMSLYTPAMPAMVASLDASATSVKLTLTAYLLAFAFGQLVAGSLSDAFGRKPVAIGFLVAYLSGTLICLAAPSVGWLMAGRLVQGIGAASGVVLARAIVRDQFDGQTAARLINATSLILISAPALAPALGGVMTQSLGWRSIFCLMLVLCAIVLCVVIASLAETRPASTRHAAAASAGKAYRVLLRQRDFIWPAITVAAVTGGVYTLSALLPFVMLEEFGLSPATFGLCMIAQAGTFGVGALWSSRLLRRWPADRLSRVGAILVVVAALGFMLQGERTSASPAGLMGALATWAFGNALINPGLIARALHACAEHAGAASALLGFLQIGFGFAGSALAALMFSDALHAIAWMMPLAAVVSTACHVALTRRQGRPR
jgi:DHA1 family bicyclomycin/chloramphenicol resistance-like MFS transporter